MKIEILISEPAKLAEAAAMLDMTVTVYVAFRLGVPASQVTLTSEPSGGTFAPEGFSQAEIDGWAEQIAALPRMLTQA